ncbi:SGNH/GDSL hydrolase family protein [Actinocrispum wychmicini]|uniref:Lysophospholipase L1-like esterase n=1 Tax=Actinocrispum wychmicini TaxID=1213861 RepID=A0A4R2ITS5_9PSEU|nr:SGNH/GDSL hydrolase family protein [Actinocrispum wychmicini]TCO48971.1 lysophospholipase L1-like esterase [Actinocrispum wychmicini]
MRVVCVGDSITRGQVSADYVGQLRTRHPAATFVNEGVNYDLAHSVRRRLGHVTAHEPDVVTVLVGTNDANSTLDSTTRRMIALMKRPPGRPTAERYRTDLAGIVQDLRDRTDARIGLLSLPVIGEELDSEPLRRAAEYSEIVREIATAHNVAYLPLHERQTAYLRTRTWPPKTQYRPGMGLSSRASIQHFMLRRGFDDISARRGLSLTTDTIHQNSRGAGMIADVISEWLC